MELEIWFTSEGRRKIGAYSVVVEAHRFRKEAGGYVLHLMVNGHHKRYFLTFGDIECVEDLVLEC